LVLPSLSLVSTSPFSNMSTDQSLLLGSTVSTLASNRVILSEGMLSINSCRVCFWSGVWTYKSGASILSIGVLVHRHTRFVPLDVTGLNRFSRFCRTDGRSTLRPGCSRYDYRQYRGDQNASPQIHVSCQSRFHSLLLLL